MDFNVSEILLVAPECLVLGMLCFILVLDAFLDDRRRHISYGLAQATLLGAALVTVALHSTEVRVGFSGSYVRDPMGEVLQIFVLFVTAGVFLYSRDYLRARSLFRGEFYVLGLFGVLGMMVLIAAHSFLTVYLGLELLSLSLYTLVAFDRDSRVASESAMKYFVLGALASGMLLYGVSMVYGVTGSLELAKVGEVLAQRQGSGPELVEMGAVLAQHPGADLALVFGLVFIVVGLAFKLGAVPFHMWLPDVYHGAPTAVTLYIASVPKIAAFALVMRVLVEGLDALQADWQGMLVLLSVLSMAVGNLFAIAQTNIKRMLAYSTIAHVGFILLGVLAGTRDGYAAAMFYTLVYALMALGAFGVVILLSRAGFEADRLEDFKGLNQRSPWFAFVMLLLMFSMAGVPPLAGFYAKLVVLQAVVNVDLLWLAVVAVLFSVIAAFYYIRIIKLMYFDDAEDDQPLHSSTDLRVVVSANGIVILALGIYPSALMSLCVASIPGP